MNAKVLVIVGVGIAAIIGSATVVHDQMTAGPSVVSEIAVAANSSTPSAQAGAQAGVKPGKAAGPSSTGATGGAAKPSAGSGKPQPPAPASQEALPQVSASSPALPVPKPPAPLIRGPLPATASAQGKIVAGFPRDVLSFPRGTVVGSTAVSASDGALQVAADAIVALNQDSVVGHFQQILGARKFWSEPVPAAQGQRAVRFSRGKDSLTLTTRSTGTGATRFMLLGNLHPAASG